MSLGDELVVPAVRLRSELIQYLSELDNLERSVYKTGNGAFDQVLDEQVSLNLNLAIKDNMNKGFGAGLDGRTNLIRSMKQKLAGVPLIEMEVAQEVTNETLKSVIGKLEKFVLTDFVVELKINPDVIAGARLTFQGKYFDGSVSKNWQELWRQAVLE